MVARSSLRGSRRGNAPRPAGQRTPRRETVAKMAEKLGVTRRKLERAFSADLGISPSRAALRIRLDAAKKLLGESNRTTTQIALSTGFCDASHFIHTFKAEIGMNPSEYRNTVPVPATLP